MVRLDSPYFQTTSSKQALRRYAPAVLNEFARAHPVLADASCNAEHVAKFVSSMPKGALGSHTFRPFDVYVRHQGIKYAFCVDPHDSTSPVERLQQAIAFRLGTVDESFAHGVQIFVCDENARRIEVPRSEKGTSLLLQYAHNRQLTDVRPAASSSSAAALVGQELPAVPEMRSPYVMPVESKKIERTAQRDTQLSRRDRLNQVRDALATEFSHVVTTGGDYRMALASPELHALAEQYCAAEQRGDASVWLGSVGTRLMRTTHKLMGDELPVDDERVADMLSKQCREHKLWAEEAKQAGLGARGSSVAQSTRANFTGSHLRQVHTDSESGTSSSSSGSSSSSSSSSSDDDQPAPDALRGKRLVRSQVGMVSHEALTQHLERVSWHRDGAKKNKHQQKQKQPAAAMVEMVACSSCGCVTNKKKKAVSMILQEATAPIECDTCAGNKKKKPQASQTEFVEDMYAADGEVAAETVDDEYPDDIDIEATQEVDGLLRYTDLHAKAKHAAAHPHKAKKSKSKVVNAAAGALKTLTTAVDSPARKSVAPGDTSRPFVPGTAKSTASEFAWTEDAFAPPLATTNTVYLEPLASGARLEKVRLQMDTDDVQAEASIQCGRQSQCAPAKQAACGAASCLVRMMHGDSSQRAAVFEVQVNGKTVVSALAYGKPSEYMALRKDDAQKLQVTIKLAGTDATSSRTIVLDRSALPKRAATLMIVNTAAYSDGPLLVLDDSDAHDDASFGDFDRAARVRVSRFTADDSRKVFMVNLINQDQQQRSASVGGVRVRSTQSNVRLTAGKYRIEVQAQGASSDSLLASLDDRKVFVGNTYTLYVLGDEAGGYTLTMTVDSRHAPLKATLTKRFSDAVKRAVIVTGEQDASLPAGVLIAPVDEHAERAVRASGTSLLDNYFCPESPSNSLRLSDARGITTLVSRNGIVYPLNDLRTSVQGTDALGVQIAGVYDHPEFKNVVVVAVRGTHQQMQRQDVNSF